jgi:uncharacterized membrane protein
MRSGLREAGVLALLAVAAFACDLAIPVSAHAQTATTTETQYVARAVVEQIVNSTLTSDPGTIPQGFDDIVSARISSGNERGKLVEFENYYTNGDGQKLDPGDIIYVTRYLADDSNSLLAVYDYSSLDHDRLPTVILFLAVFVGCIIYFGGRQGIRGLVSLAGGISFIVFLLLPGVIHGYSPLFLSIVVASFVASLGAYITHGFSRMTTAAIIGMVLTIIAAAVLAEIGVHFGYLSGVTDENSYNLLTNPASNVVINFQGLLLGGIIIGLLGVLYDAAIGQAVAVEELFRVGPHLPRSVIYERALRIGREHIGALVNTLVLAYVGASLPVMLTLYESLLGNNGYMPPFLNWEFVATEVIRTTVGATGLILTIPITTWVAVRMLVPERSGIDPDIGVR